MMALLPKIRVTAQISAALAIVMASFSFAEPARQDGEWCGTPMVNQAVLSLQKPTDPNACTQFGACDNPGTRNSYIPDGSSGTLVVRMYIHVLRNDDGSNPAASATDVVNQMNQLNADFAASGIQFEYQWRFVNSTAYRQLSSSEDFPMKNAFAISPDSQLNVYVTSLASQGLLGYAYLPWTSVALQNGGGCVVTDAANGGFGAGRKTLTHEVGHNLGLHHTQRGISEVSGCGDACYENPGAPDTDLTGDLCSDTRPTPTNFNCGDPGGNACNGQPYAPTPFRNYMGYASDACYTHFSAQQMGRMRCWTQAALGTWLTGVQLTGTPTFGPAPLSVDFTGLTSKTVTDWDWDFGDGGTSNVQNPSHTYTTAGLRDVAVTIQTSEGPYSASNEDFVWAYADTMDANEVIGSPSQKIKVDIYMQNYLPLQAIQIPFTWAGPLALPLDSVVTTGLRSSGMDLTTLFSDVATKRRVVYLSGVGGGTLAPGSGPILSLWFRLPPFLLSGVNPITIAPITLYQVECLVQPGTYIPVYSSGSVAMSCCRDRAGNVDNDGADVTDISDLTALIDHLFISLGPLACAAEGNCDGDSGGAIDIADLTALIDHLFISLDPLPLCQ